ncbi:sulfatase-like hydrolase/transferase [Membranicola marinus]|uniref:Sulfatase-like hydrolase/transferase n=1 Tax=Membranihabitans marinus TaxID=1227546 RepID=A0A953L5M4_9BACT|nr:sulfatase-like hydrolase/transferase [Membranihabitans marinus]MBY5956742.1 sulfatase-like hydrolase/transferase [Membranihabitans marinus]
MKIHYLLISIFFLTACTPTHQTNKEEQQPPNIIFILTDDLGWGDLGTFFQNQRAKEGNKAHPWQRTPHLDKMADQGVMLTDHYCNAPVCAPSRASFLLGVHQGHSNVRDNQFDKRLGDNYTVANVLKAAGYGTVAVGKWGLQGDNRYSDNGDEWPGHPLNRGFDEFYGYMRHRDGHEHYPVEGIYRGKKEVYHNHEEVSDGLAKCFTGDLWTAFAKKWIVDYNKKEDGQPFFMFLAYDTPHAVIELPTQEYPSGGGVNGGLQWTGEPGHMINTASGEVDSWTHPDYANATWDDDQDPSTAEVPWPDTYKRFATVNRRIDDAVGDVRQLLRDLNLEENTMVIFTSDNGPSRESYLPEEYAVFTPEFFKSYGLFDGIKRDLWEGGLRVPTIVTWPKQLPKGAINDAPVMMSDWLATFCEAAGIQAPERSDGNSLLPILRDQQPATNPVYVEYAQNGKTPSYDDFLPAHQGRKRGQMQMIRLQDMVGVRYDIQSHQDDFEIYDVSKDPQQGHNLANDSQYDDLQKQMKNKVLQMRRPNSSASRPYDTEYIPALTKPENGLTAGLKARLYDVDSRWIPKTNQLAPVHEKVVNTIRGNTFPSNKSSSGNMVVYSGYVNVPESGEYTLQTTSSNQTIVRIHDALVIDGDFRAGESMSREGTIRLAAGYHPIRIYVKKKNDEESDFDLKVRFSMGGGYMSIPEEYLFH